MGETRVDLHHLLEDLRDAYPGSVEETILTEIVANSLDSGATSVRLIADPEHSTMTAIDDGHGMKRRDLSRYHDLAATSKTRGEGIGFAGVGIKLGLLNCEEVVTETMRGKSHVASRWSLVSRRRAPWKWIEPPGLLGRQGTAIRLRPANPLSPLLDPGFLESCLARNFEPLFDARFDAILSDHYRSPIQVEVNGGTVGRNRPGVGESVPVQIRLGRRRKPSAFGYLTRAPFPLAEDQRGIGISTFGKVIKRGWDWLGIAPTNPERCTGLVEVPELAACLTLNKADFIRSGPRGALYLTFRKAIQESVSRQLAAWGDVRDAEVESRRRATRPLERDLERVLLDLAEDFPLLAALVDRRSGGQKRLPIGGTANREGSSSIEMTLASPRLANEGVTERMSPAGTDGALSTTAAESQPPAPWSQDVAAPATGGKRRPTRLGLSIQFDSRPNDPELGRLIESVVWINESHPAYLRAIQTRSQGYHIALAVALALAPLAVELASEHRFVTEFLSQWGQSVVRYQGRKSGRSSR